jgi:hypothetical protein
MVGQKDGELGPRSSYIFVPTCFCPCPGGALLFAIWDWRTLVVPILVIVAISLILATLFYILAFCLALFKYRSFTKSHHVAWDIWKHCFFAILDRLG